MRKEIYICDHCKKELKSNNNEFYFNLDGIESNYFHFCLSCKKEFVKLFGKFLNKDFKI